MAVPERWEGYLCADYFDGGWADRGHFHEPSQCLVVVPLHQVYEKAEVGFFAIGRSGCGGIDFGYRRGHAGLWAYHPVGGRWQYMAPSVADLVEGWCSGRLFV